MIVFAAALLAWAALVGHQFEVCPVVDGRPGAWADCIKTQRLHREAAVVGVPAEALR